jgi:hypothetical protein
MSNQGYLRYTKLSLNARKAFKRIRRMHRKNLCGHGEDTKRLLAYSHTTPRDIKVRITQLIIIRIERNCMFFPSTLDGMDLAKKPSHATVLLNSGTLIDSRLIWTGM